MLQKEEKIDGKTEGKTKGKSWKREKETNEVREKERERKMRAKTGRSALQKTLNNKVRGGEIISCGSKNQ